MLAYAGSAEAAEDAALHCAVSAAGRFFGDALLSDALRRLGARSARLWGSAAMIKACRAFASALQAQRGG